MDLFDDGSFHVGSTPLSARKQAIVRVIFGLFGAVLAAAGIWRMALMPTGLHLRIPAVTMFIGLFLICLWNIALRRRGKLPVWLLVFGFAGLFVSRVVFGR